MQLSPTSSLDNNHDLKYPKTKLRRIPERTNTGLFGEDTRFEFPGADFYGEISDNGLGMGREARLWTGVLCSVSPIILRFQLWVSTLNQNFFCQSKEQTLHRLEKIYRYLLQLLALPLTPHGSHGLIEKQIHEICGRLPGSEAGSKQHFPARQNLKLAPGT